MLRLHEVQAALQHLHVAGSKVWFRCMCCMVLQLLHSFGNDTHSAFQLYAHATHTI
jgi:hypothetical protein